MYVTVNKVSCTVKLAVQYVQYYGRYTEYMYVSTAKESIVNLRVV